jgi:CO/xanthine dehydrogenase FAD-binding subunit
MKPAPFEYASPRGLEEALGLLGPAAKPLAGGQSLVALLNFRLARPELVVDINRVAELAYLRRSEGSLRIGALCRQAALERSLIAARVWPLLVDAVGRVAHPQVRSRGTVGGSVAHADPAAELPAALLALDARFHVRSASEARVLSGEELFRGPLMTALAPEELLVEVEVPPPPSGAGMAFVEQAPTHGDFAEAGVAAVVAPEGAAAIALFAVGPTARRAPRAERALAAGADPAEAGALAAKEIEDPYRRALFGELVRRAVTEATP